MSQRLRTGRDALNDAGRALMDLGEELGWHAQELTASVLLVAPGDPAHSFTVDLPPERKWRANKAEQKRAMLFEHGDQLKVAAWHARHPKPGPPLKITAQPSVFVKPEPELPTLELPTPELPEREVISMEPTTTRRGTPARVAVTRLWSDGSTDTKCAAVECDEHRVTGQQRTDGAVIDHVPSLNSHYVKTHDRDTPRHFDVPWPHKYAKERRSKPSPRPAPITPLDEPQLIELQPDDSVKTVESVITEPVEELDTLAEIVRLVHERGLCELPAVQAELRATRTELEDMKTLFALSEEENKEIPALRTERDVYKARNAELESAIADLAKKAQAGS